MRSPLPYPGKRPYPNPLDPTDANIDYDGDGLTLSEEYRLWATPGVRQPRRLHQRARPELQRRRPDHRTDGRPAHARQRVHQPRCSRSSTSTATARWTAQELMALDFNKNGTVSDREVAYMDTDQVMGIPDGQGVLSDDEKDADHDGLTNYDETHGRMTAGLSGRRVRRGRDGLPDPLRAGGLHDHRQRR